MYAEAKARVALPVATAWNRLSDLRSLSQWAPDVAASTVEGMHVGATRWVRLYAPIGGKAVLIERITDVDANQRTFTYDIQGGIGPFTEVQVTWRVTPSEGGSLVTVSSLVTVAGVARFMPILVLKRWTARLQAWVEGFARWAEDLDGDVEVMDGPEPAPEPQVSVELVELDAPVDPTLADDGPADPTQEPVVKVKAKAAPRRTTSRRPARGKTSTSTPKRASR